MTLWKLGCRWGKNYPPLFYDFIKAENIVISSIGQPYQIDDWILVANGHSILAFAKVLETLSPSTNFRVYKDQFLKHKIPYNNTVTIAKADWIILDSVDRFDYVLQQGICKVHQKEIIATFHKLLNKYQKKLKITSMINLLAYKKQIILQGPPGTGKTKRAKELAGAIIGETQLETVIPHTITKKDIQDTLTIDLIINSVTAGSDYKIKEINNNNVKVELTGGTSYLPSYTEIIKWYANQKWDKGQQVGGTDPYAAAIAKYIYQNIKTGGTIAAEDSEQYKLIQFHPSYSYEDFVRGITAKPTESGEGILYEAENKTLAAFADKALHNYLDSNKKPEELSEEIWLENAFRDFVVYIAEQLDKGPITLSEKVNLIGLDHDAFRYKGETGWSKYGNRMLFEDIRQSYLDRNSERQDLVNNDKLAGLANWHATYYLAVLNMFKDYLTEKENVFVENLLQKTPLKNYVLIIDEINRANLSSVLGELIYALEYRGEKVESMYSVKGKNDLILPPNLFIIGTMNTADRSIGHIDYAIRRRFAFVDVRAEDLTKELGTDFKTGLFEKVSALFDHKTNLSREFNPLEVRLGHSYFIQQYEKDNKGKNITEKPYDFELRLEYEIKPILLEYVKDGILIGEKENKTISEYITSLSN
ncbi:MAG TPA: AAA family ATPase [Flavobacterium sp.]|nr:AAA family ATPase [Flavobacterium sp.]